MRMRLKHLVVQTRQTTERVDFSHRVTFIYGPVGTGKSTVARLVDYCFGGELERTPAIQREFVSATLRAELGEYECTLERGAADTQAVRVTWARGESNAESVSAPFSAGSAPVVGDDVFNLSDLLFRLCGVDPIKVRQRSRDPDSPMIRLSFRDIWAYCYLEQTHLDSSCFRLEDPFRGRKSQDAMRFFTGLHSERLSQLESELYRAIDDQRAKREAVQQIRRFMDRFSLGSELDVAGQLQQSQQALIEAEGRRDILERERQVTVHPTDDLRGQLRHLGGEIADLLSAVSASVETIEEQLALRAELLTAKIKAERTEKAGRILEGVDYMRCPQCGTDLSSRTLSDSACRLCRSENGASSQLSSLELEVARREFNDRIDQIADSIQRRQRALDRSQKQLAALRARKVDLDEQLQTELARYDSAFVESIRVVDREIATLVERLRSLRRLQEMPRAISELEEEAGALQGRIDVVRSSIDDERGRLRRADENIGAIADRFKEFMLAVQLPGVSQDDEVLIDPRNWRPKVVHCDQEWDFWDAGSGGKKTLFNVCYALAVHETAQTRGMPVPSVLIIDSPTKNISEDVNPELVQSLYRLIYRIAGEGNGAGIQFLLIDSDLVEPEVDLAGFSQRRMAGEPEAPKLISYYDGP